MALYPSTPAPPPPPPPPQKVTIPAGTTLAVRLVDGIDSEKNQTGGAFRAILNVAFVGGGGNHFPSGYDVEGHLVEVKSAGKFAGQSVVAMQLDRISVGGRSYSIQTDQYKREGSSRGRTQPRRSGPARRSAPSLAASRAAARGPASEQLQAAASAAACRRPPRVNKSNFPPRPS